MFQSLKIFNSVNTRSVARSESGDLHFTHMHMNVNRIIYQLCSRYWNIYFATNNAIKAQLLSRYNVPGNWSLHFRGKWRREDERKENRLHKDGLAIPTYTDYIFHALWTFDTLRSRFGTCNNFSHVKYTSRQSSRCGSRNIRTTRSRHDPCWSQIYRTTISLFSKCQNEISIGTIVFVRLWNN